MDTKILPLLFLTLCLLLSACAPTATQTVDVQPTEEISVATNTPGTDIYHPPANNNTTEAITEPAVAVQTSLASLFKVFIDNTLDNTVKLDTYAQAATPVVDGVATVTYPEGGVHPLYVCVDVTHANLLENLVISSFANPAKMMYPASVVNITGLNLECNQYTENPYNLTGDGNLAVGTPTAESTILPNFNLVLSFVAAPKPNGGGGGSVGDGESNNGGTGGNCTPPLQWDPDLQACVDDGNG